MSDVAFQLMNEEQKEVWKRFKSLILRNEGKLRGELGEYVTEALERYMDSLKERKEKKVLPENRNISIKRAISIRQDILNGGDFEIGDRVPEAVLERKIKKIAGSSHVTLRKYKNLLNGFHLVSQIGTGSNGTTVYEIPPEPEWMEEIT